MTVPVVVRVCDPWEPRTKRLAEIDAAYRQVDALEDLPRRRVNVHAGRIFICKGEEYAQDRFSAASFRDEGLTVSAHRVSKKEPWTTVDVRLQAPIGEIESLDETLEDRQRAVGT